jgi:hypothetical protein
MVAYDAADGYVLLFGGLDTTGGNVLYGDTWTFANGTWHNLTSEEVASPAPRYLGAMAYDAADHCVVLFGGYNGAGTAYNDTWIFENDSWESVNVTGASPSPLWRATMTYDAADGYVLLFGGTTAAGAPRNETWSFSGGTWTNRTANTSGAPPARYRAAMTYDAADGYVLLFGGCTTVTAGCSSSDTWKYVAGNWTDLTGSVGTPPPARVYAAMSYDPATDSVLLFGGATSTAGAELADTWEFTAGYWYDLTANQTQSPSARSLSALIPAWPAGYLLLFGGNGVGGQLADSWAYGPEVIAQVQATPALLDLGLGVNLTTLAFSNDLPLRYTYSGLPPGCPSVNSSQIQCTPTEAGTSIITVTVNDTTGAGTTASSVVEVRPDPTLTAFGPDPAATTLGRPIEVTTSVEGGVAAFDYQYGGLPPGCPAVNASSFACDPSEAGTFNLSVVVTDRFGRSVFGNASLQVNPALEFLQFSATPAAIDVNGSSRLVATVSGGTAPLSYVYRGLPPGCETADLSTLLCRPSAPGTFDVNVSVDDSAGTGTNASLDLAVFPALSFTAFTLSPGVIDLGEALTFFAGTVGGNGSVSIRYEGTPPGCANVVGASGECVPTALGTYTVTAVANDGVGGNATRFAVVTIDPLPSIVQFVAFLPRIDLGQVLGFQGQLAGGTPPWVVSFTGLPAGCVGPTSSLDFVCTPTSSGPSAVVATVTDRTGAHNSTSAVLIVVAPDPRVISTSVFPASPTVGEGTEITVLVSGGTAPFTFAYTGLPTGCSSRDSGDFNCTPTSAGFYSVRVQVSDASGTSVNGSFWFNVSRSASASSGGPGVSVLGIVGVIVVAAALFGLWALRGRRRRAPPIPAASPPASPASPVAPAPKPEYIED